MDEGPGANGLGGAVRESGPGPVSAVLALAASLNLVVTAAFQWLPVAALGAGGQTDALFASAVVPQLLVSVATTALAAVLTPGLAPLSAPDRRARAWTDVQRVAAGAALLAVGLGVTADVWVAWIMPGFDRPAQRLAASLTRIQLAGAAVAAVLAVPWAVASVRGQFVRVELIGAVAGAMALSAAWAGLPRLGVTAVAWAAVLRSLVQVVLLAPVLGTYHPPAAAPDDRDRWRGAWSVAAGTVYTRLDPMVDRALASLAPPGHLSLLHLAMQLWSAGLQVLSRTLIGPLLPDLARRVATGDVAGATAVRDRRLWEVVAVAGVAWCLVAIAGRPVLRWMLVGSVSSAQANLLHLLLVVLAGAWIGGVAGQVLSVAFFARRDTATPTRIGVIGLTLALPLKLVATWRWGVTGLAAATSTYVLANALAQYWRLDRAPDPVRKPPAPA